MNKPFACLALLAVSLVISLRAHGEFVVEVTKGQTEAIPIAVVPFASAELAAASFDVAQPVAELTDEGLEVGGHHDPVVLTAVG